MHFSAYWGNWLLPHAVTHHWGVLFCFVFLKTVYSLPMVLLGRAGLLFALRKLKLRQAAWPAKAHQTVRIPRRTSTLASQFKPFLFSQHVCFSRHWLIEFNPFHNAVLDWPPSLGSLSKTLTKRRRELLQGPIWGSGRKPAWNSYLVVPDIPWAFEGFSISGQTFTTLWSMQY